MNLKYFNELPFYDSLNKFFSDLNIPVNTVTAQPAPPQDLITNFNPEKEAHNLIDSLYFLGMVDDAAFENISSATKLSDIKNQYDGLLIFGVVLKKRNKNFLPTRSQLAEITRLLNREFHYTPVIIVFKYDKYIAFSSIERIRYKQEWREGEKTGKVSLLKDVIPDNTHTGHLKILQNLVIPRTGKEAVNSFEDLYKYWQKVFSVSILNKEFYRELSNWYFWSLEQVSFPDDVQKNQKIRNATNLIRLITRLIFVWFIKEKKLVPDNIFQIDELHNIIKNYLKNKKSNTYYPAIMQNLFFGTLNQKIKDRKFAKNIDNIHNRKEYGVKNYFRHEELFLISEEEALALFKDVPFLNGGLFDCLDKPDENGKIIYDDGFSRNSKKQAVVPDELFFSDEQEVELNEYYGTKNKKYKTKGIINILNSYKFTIAENTPVEEEIALDPELLGRVFENLLASYNPETQTTARKQTGSFYTPREIVNYMVDESLIAYLKQKILSDNKELAEDKVESKLRQLINYEDEKNPFNEPETLAIIDAIDNCKILDPACGSGAFPMGILHKLVHLLHKLDPKNQYWKEKQIQKVSSIDDVSLREKWLEDIETAFNNNEFDYSRKLYLIENCIYGVDIQPIAVQISKLRFFISLIVDQTVNRNQKNYGIRSLPNLETKFIAANTLIGLDKPKQLSIRDYEITKLEDELKSIRHKYFSSKTRTEKLHYQQQDKKLREKISKLLISSSWSNTAAEQLANFDPYDQNASSPFFDPEWMFAITNGFDIVIGNPPYVQIQKFSGKEEQLNWQKQKFESYEKTGDIYCLFYEKGNLLLNEKGILCYITSNKWLRANYGKSLRNYLAKNTQPYLLIDFGGFKVFEAATVDTNILIFTKHTKNNKKTIACSIKNDFKYDTDIKNYVLENNIILKELSEMPWIIISKKEYFIKDRIEQKGTPLKDWDIQINYGIKTGFNQAFIIDGKKKDELLAADPKSAEIIKPILRGRDIKRYKVEFADLWLINTHNGYYDENLQKQILRVEINDYPVIKKYLDNYYPQLEKRQDKGETPYNLRNCAYMSEFEKEKIIYPNMTKFRPFIYDTKKYYTNQKCFILVSSSNTILKYLISILNSWVFEYAFKDYFPELLGGTRELSKVFFVNLPIPKLSDKQQQPFSILVDLIMFAKEKGFNTESETFESVIDGLVYDLYFPDEMKNGGCYITDRISEKIKPFKPEDTDDFKIEYIKTFHNFCLKDKVIYRGLIHRRNIDIVKTVNSEKE